MIFPDANLLLYAEDSLSKHHEAARDWWDTALELARNLRGEASSFRPTTR